MPKISSEKAVEMIGNRYDLILIAARRARELKHGHAPKVKTQAGPVITALHEIENGHIGSDYLKKYRRV